MSNYYFDSDALVKYFIREPGTSRVRELVSAVGADGGASHKIATLELGQVEVSAALAIIRRLGRIGRHLQDTAFRDYLALSNSRLQLLSIDTLLVEEASLLPQKHPLKALDALHLAAALRLDRELSLRRLPLTLVSSDHQILNAARREGLLTENPQDHGAES